MFSSPSSSSSWKEADAANDSDLSPIDLESSSDESAADPPPRSSRGKVVYRQKLEAVAGLDRELNPRQSRSRKPRVLSRAYRRGPRSLLTNPQHVLSRVSDAPSDDFDQYEHTTEDLLCHCKAHFPTVADDSLKLVSALGKRHADLMCVQNPRADPYHRLDDTALSSCALLVDWFLDSLVRDVKKVKRELLVADSDAAKSPQKKRKKKKKKKEQ
mmetsp:Transcript_32634/g.81826  ORF Transcript_32634/g.81826 Transcript_32634/m.81826 type:complete len:214 (-) Transcript_32634:10-651(-)